MYIDTNIPVCFNLGMETGDVLSTMYALAFEGVLEGLTFEEAWRLAAESIGPEALALIVS